MSHYGSHGPIPGHPSSTRSSRHTSHLVLLSKIGSVIWNWGQLSMVPLSWSDQAMYPSDSLALFLLQGGKSNFPATDESRRVPEIASPSVLHAVR